MYVTKGQIKPKADWRAVDSPKKQTNEYGFFCHEKKILFFGTIYGAPICLRFYLTFRHGLSRFWVLHILYCPEFLRASNVAKLCLIQTCLIYKYFDNNYNWEKMKPYLPECPLFLVCCSLILVHTVEMQLSFG